MEVHYKVRLEKMNFFLENIIKFLFYLNPGL